MSAKYSTPRRQILTSSNPVFKSTELNTQVLHIYERSKQNSDEENVEKWQVNPKSGFTHTLLWMYGIHKTQSILVYATLKVCEYTTVFPPSNRLMMVIIPSVNVFHKPCLLNNCVTSYQER